MVGQGTREEFELGGVSGRQNTDRFGDGAGAEAVSQRDSGLRRGRGNADFGHKDLLGLYHREFVNFFAGNACNVSCGI